jgi:SEC-C motif domain protein
LQAPDAEALMRSRYSAFARGDAEYLLATWHPSTCPATLELEPGVRWLGLEVKRHTAMGADRATVRFVARCRAASGRAQRLEETSHFQREAGRWFYVDGTQH